jgi:7-carboxy-7-deazaguanine synthase
MSTKHLINSIYRASEGEGIYLGRPQIFVRYQGCSVGCVNCDSKDTWDFSSESAQSIESILEQVYTEGFNGSIKTVSITGGDPLHPSHVPHVLELVARLKDKNYYINIEAAGTRVVDEIFDLVDFVSFDFKTPSTGVKTPIRNLSKMITQYGNKMQIKSVIYDKVDFEATLEAYQTLQKENLNMNFPWVLTPCYNLGEAFPMERFASIIAMNEANGAYFRVIGQQHKWIFGPDKKQV